MSEDRGLLEALGVEALAGGVPGILGGARLQTPSDLGGGNTSVAFVAGLVLVISGCLAGPTSPETPQDTFLDHGSNRADGVEDDTGTAEVLGASQASKTETDWPQKEEAALRPGAPIFNETCTAGFLFTSKHNDTRYVSTAAHCTYDISIGDEAPAAEGEVNITLVYDSWKTMEEIEEESRSALLHNDFALLRINPEDYDNIHPALPEFGGPTYIGPIPEVEDHVLSHGASRYHQDMNEAEKREGYVAKTKPWYTESYFVTPAVYGDSGSPIIHEDGRAVALLTTLSGWPPPGTNGGVNIPTAVSYMEEHSDLNVSLATSPVTDRGELPSDPSDPDTVEPQEPHPGGKPENPSIT